MSKNLGIISFILVLILSLFLILETNNLLGIFDLNIKPLIFTVALVIVLIFSIVNLLLFVSSCNKKPEIVEKIIYKEADKIVATEEEVERQVSEEEMIEKALELSEKILYEAREINDFEKYCDKILSNFAKNFNIVQGLFFVIDNVDEKYKTKGTYAFYSDEAFREFELGMGLTGQVAKSKKYLSIGNVPEQYIKILSGLGNSSPNYLTLFPIVYEEKTIAILELASFEKIDEELEKLFLHVSLEIGVDLYRFLQ